MPLDLWEVLWALNLHPKYGMFIWKVLHRIIAAKDGLRRRRIIEESSCVFCGSAEETVDHLFLQCE